MARRRRILPGGEPSNVTTQEGKPPAPAGRASMRVEVEGDPDTVREKMGMNADRPRAPEAPEAGADEKAFFDALQKPDYRFQVKRILPREVSGRDARLVVFEDACPMLYQDIVDEVTRSYGGKKYRATVFNPADGKSVAAKTFTVDGEPKLPAAAVDEQSLQDMIDEEAEPDDAQRLQNTFNNQIRMAEQQLNLERTQDMLDSLKKKRDRGSGGSGDDQQIRALEKRLDDERHQRDLDKQKAQHDREIAELRASIDRLSHQPPKQEGKSDIALVLERMTQMQEDSNRRFERIMEKQREDKVDLVLKQLNTMGTAGQVGSLKEMMVSFKQMRDIFDGGSGEVDEEEDGEDKEWWEKLIDHLPKITEKLGGMSKGGKAVTKDEFMSELNAAADAATKAEIAKLERQAPPPQLPAPSPATKVDALPAPAPAAPGSQPAAPAAAPAAAAAPVQTAEIETMKMAAGVIGFLKHEIELRKRSYQWNYEGAWQNLPEPLLEKLCAAPDPATMVDALIVPGLPADVVAMAESVKALAAQSPRAARWIAAGHKELQRWWSELEKNPDFDPSQEEDDGELEEEDGEKTTASPE